MIREFFNKILNSKSQIYLSELDKFKKFELEEIERQKKTLESDPFVVLRGTKSSYFDFGTLRKDYIAILDNKAKLIVSNLMENFKDKQVAKLNEVVKNHEIEKIKLIGQDLNSLKIKITFKNKNEFTVVNQVVTVYNELENQGRSFTRFPTTFHDIKLGDKFYKTKSHAWLVDSF
jgi:hypothetical protein